LFPATIQGFTFNLGVSQDGEIRILQTECKRYTQDSEFNEYDWDASAALEITITGTEPLNLEFVSWSGTYMEDNQSPVCDFYLGGELIG
jgi:hypothetical protein